MQNRQMKHVVRGAFILSLASLVTKILSAVYRVPFQNLVGNTGFYVYQQIYPPLWSGHDVCTVWFARFYF